MHDHTSMCESLIPVPLGGGTAMRYSLTPPLALEAVYLATSAPVGLPF